MATLAASKLSDGRLQMWAVVSGSLLSSWQTSLGGGWTPLSPFSPAPGGVVLSVSAGHSPDGRVELWVGVDVSGLNVVKSTWKLSGNPDSDWEPWQNPFSPELGTGGSTPLVGQLADGRMQLFANFGATNNLDLNGSLVTMWKTSTEVNAAWSGWQKFNPDPILSPPDGQVANPYAAGQLPGGPMQLWILGVNDNVLESSRMNSAALNSGWSPWQKPFNPVLNGQADGNGAAAQLPDGRLQLWVMTLPGPALQTAWQAPAAANSAWTPWEAFPDPGPVSSVAAAQLADGRVILWATAGGVFTCQKLTTAPNADWTNWVAIPI